MKTDPKGATRSIMLRERYFRQNCTSVCLSDLTIPNFAKRHLKMQAHIGIPCYCELLGDPPPSPLYPEKLTIINAKKRILLNNRSEIVSKCRYSEQMQWRTPGTNCVCCVPFWNMCHPETCFRLAWCAVLKSLHGTNLKHVSEMHIFLNGTSCQSETCFRMAHVSKRHATSVLIGGAGHDCLNLNFRQNFP